MRALNVKTDFELILDPILDNEIDSLENINDLPRKCLKIGLNMLVKQNKLSMGACYDIRVALKKTVKWDYMTRLD